jgi:hypothetical protein
MPRYFQAMGAGKKAVERISMEDSLPLALKV